MYSLRRLAPGSYDLELDGEVIAGVVRSGERETTTWHAELLSDDPGTPRPAPFTDPEHTFPTLEAVLEWLGRPELRI